MKFSPSDFDLTLVEVPESGKHNRQGQAKILTQDELARILNGLGYIADHWPVAYAIAYFTGSRIGEVLALKADAIVDGHVRFLKQTTKTNRFRSAQIVPQLQTVLDTAGLPNNGYLFPSGPTAAKRAYISRQAGDSALRQVCEAEGITGVSTHSFRRSFATHLYRAGRSINEISKLLGHSSVKTTQRYIG